MGAAFGWIQDDTDDVAVGRDRTMDAITHIFDVGDARGRNRDWLARVSCLVCIPRLAEWLQLLTRMPCFRCKTARERDESARPDDLLSEKVAGGSGGG